MGKLTKVVGVVAHDITEVARCGSSEVHRHQLTKHQSALENERSSKGVLHGVGNLGRPLEGCGWVTHCWRAGARFYMLAVVWSCCAMVKPTPIGRLLLLTAVTYPGTSVCDCEDHRTCQSSAALPQLVFLAPSATRLARPSGSTVLGRSSEALHEWPSAAVHRRRLPCPPASLALFSCPASSMRYRPGIVLPPTVAPSSWPSTSGRDPAHLIYAAMDRLASAIRRV